MVIRGPVEIVLQMGDFILIPIERVPGLDESLWSNVVFRVLHVFLTDHGDICEPH